MAEKYKINEELYKDHENRPDLAGEHPIGDPLQLTAAVIFLIIIILDYIYLQTYKVFGNLVPMYMRFLLGFSTFAFGGWLALRGIQIVFKDLRPEPVMITEGMFSKVRHPIYLGAMLVYVGFLFITFSVVGAIYFIFVIFLYHWLAKHEEELMIGIFADKYHKYKVHVPMWLPRIFDVNGKR